MGYILLVLLGLVLIKVSLYLLILYYPAGRQRWLSRPLFAYFRRALPPLSRTEREAMEAGTVWWEAELFRGQPDWSRLHALPKPALTAQEQAFLDEVVDPLLAQINDFEIVSQQRDLPESVWRYLREHGFFSLVIPQAYGGKGFSHYAMSTIVGRMASRSMSAAVTIMVPNSLGPAELLLHYGTAEQKAYWLPRLARSEEFPCFALTGPEAGSDAGAIPDQGIVCHGDWQGESIVGIRLNWNKRYITLAPRATVLGLAFKLSDPEHLLGDTTDYGITCALIPTSHPGVEIGHRHFPMGQAFLNGPTWGHDVFIPLDWIIGGVAYAGKGWRMLVECLSAGRGVSLPALGTACGHLATRTTSAYTVVRQQFGLSIGQFEGVQEALARIGAYTYQLEAARRLTTTALDQGERPGITTAIAKYHMTELARQLLSDAMDVHGGRGVQLGPHNYLGHLYMGIPIAITVEGANILTRNLMIFGQGAVRCHPYLYDEMQAAGQADAEQGLQQFDALLVRHIRYFVRNLMHGVVSGLTQGRFESTPRSGPVACYYRHLNRISRVLAVCSDVAMLLLGGELKRREMLSARLGDVLSQLYLCSATLKYFEEEGAREEDLPAVHYLLRRSLWQMGQSLSGVFDNLRPVWAGYLLRYLLFPLGMPWRPVRDKVINRLCRQLQQPGSLRERLTALCFWRDDEDDAVGQVERAFHAMLAVAPLEQKVLQAKRDGLLPAQPTRAALMQAAQAQGLITVDELMRWQQADQQRYAALQVDSFAPGELAR